MLLASPRAATISRQLSHYELSGTAGRVSLLLRQNNIFIFSRLAIDAAAISHGTAAAMIFRHCAGCAVFFICAYGDTRSQPLATPLTPAILLHLAFSMMITPLPAISPEGQLAEQRLSPIRLRH